MQPKEYGDTWGISLGIWARVKEIGSEHPSELLNIKWQKKKRERERERTRFFRQKLHPAIVLTAISWVGSEGGLYLYFASGSNLGQCSHKSNQCFQKEHTAHSAKALHVLFVSKSNGGRRK